MKEIFYMEREREREISSRRKSGSEYQSERWMVSKQGKG